MKILVACEFSGTVRDAFIRSGHDAWSCDLLPSDSPAGPHIQGDIGLALRMCWGMMIAFPPCTHLCVSGARWFREKQAEQAEAIAFFMRFAESEIPRIAIENPVGVMSTRWRRPDQIVQPWQHGHGETKATCLWLKGLPKLSPSKVVHGREARIHRLPQSKGRWKIRSTTFPGIAEAMANQWGG